MVDGWSMVTFLSKTCSNMQERLNFLKRETEINLGIKNKFMISTNFNKNIWTFMKSLYYQVYISRNVSIVFFFFQYLF